MPDMTFRIWRGDAEQGEDVARPELRHRDLRLGPSPDDEGKIVRPEGSFSPVVVHHDRGVQISSSHRITTGAGLLPGRTVNLFLTSR